MALVLVFVPEPVKGVAEMRRVVKPGGMVAAYMWDMPGGGFPVQPIIDEMRAMGLAPPRPPQMDASRLEAMRDLWTGAGLKAMETREITVHRTFANFDDFWTAKMKAPSLGPTVAAAHGLPWDLWEIRLDGSGLRRLTNLAEDDPSLAWSPDGRWLAFQGGSGVYIVDVATTTLYQLSEAVGFGGMDWAADQ